MLISRNQSKTFSLYGRNVIEIIGTKYKVVQGGYGGRGRSRRSDGFLKLTFYDALLKGLLGSHTQEIFLSRNLKVTLGC